MPKVTKAIEAKEILPIMNAKESQRVQEIITRDESVDAWRSLNAVASVARLKGSWADYVTKQDKGIER